MTTTGAIAPNLHEGTRSEYLAQYVFSAFGTSVAVPHPEDSGIDLHCTLGSREGQRLLVSHYFSVQVKSGVSPIAYPNPSSVRWLLGHRYPLLICYVDKGTHRISVYQTLPVTMCYAKDGVSSVTLVPEPDPAGFHVIKSEAKLELRIGPPILEFAITRLEDAAWLQQAVEILKKWIEIDQANIDHKAFGVTLFSVPQSYAPNQMPSDVWQSLGNFREFQGDPKRRALAIDAFFKILSHLVTVAAANQDQGRVQTIAEFSVKWFVAERPEISKALEFFVNVLNTSMRHVGLEGGIRLTEHRPDGPVTGYPVMSVED
ncbi:DUF4365 domain-containing protein [bacterium]|nr:DUF4365 domain-containing protein [bacterium]